MQNLTEAAAQKTKELVEVSTKDLAQWDLERAARMKELQKQTDEFEEATLSLKKISSHEPRIGPPCQG